MNDVTEVKFTEVTDTKPKFHIPLVYKILFVVQAVSMSIIYAAAKGWLN